MMNECEGIPRGAYFVLENVFVVRRRLSLFLIEIQTRNMLIKNSLFYSVLKSTSKLSTRPLDWMPRFVKFGPTDAAAGYSCPLSLARFRYQL